MVAAENRLGIYLAVPAYFLVLTGCLYWVSAKKKGSQDAAGGVPEKIESHFLAGRDVNWFITACTFFTSLYSGYTIIGVPVSLCH